MADSEDTSGSSRINPFTNVPVELTVSVGRLRPLVRELLALEPGSVLQMDRRIDEPVEIFVGNRLFARGELQENPESGTGQLAVRLTEFLDTPHDG
ncbi:MAG: FliM/FliN family flagellar motor C-terminal domain-containing protein [Pseudomonadota bacterium]